ncbi:MAG: HNH endonuclease, partial [Rhizobiales bacterium]|nr:HNH endonuclease [Hyphomicrobiales bacterium]
HRDWAFPVVVMAAYDNRCAMTGSRVMDRYGRWEAEAAHIRPVARGGPDLVCNGIAFSRSVHWMFDAGLLSIADDYTILVASRLRPEDRRGWPPLHESWPFPRVPNGGRIRAFCGFIASTSSRADRPVKARGAGAPLDKPP